MKKSLLLICFLLGNLWAFAQNGAISFGPMLHLNIGEKPNRLSFGFEAAYWNLEKFPAGIDVGVDFQKGVKRFYFEGQVGIGLAGVSAGPVFEKKKMMLPAWAGKPISGLIILPALICAGAG